MVMTPSVVQVRLLPGVYHYYEALRRLYSDFTLTKCIYNAFFFLFNFYNSHVYIFLVAEYMEMHGFSSRFSFTCLHNIHDSNNAYTIDGTIQ